MARNSNNGWLLALREVLYDLFSSINSTQVGHIKVNKDDFGGLVEFWFNGEKQTLGVMMPGEYTFDTKEAEIMEMLSGDLDIKLPGEEWKTLHTPETFNVPANSSFDLKIKSVTDYCCSYFE